MKNFNRILTFLLGLSLTGMMVFFIKDRDDAKFFIDKQKAQDSYNALLLDNAALASSRAAKQEEINKAMAEAVASAKITLPPATNSTITAPVYQIIKKAPNRTTKTS